MFNFQWPCQHVMGSLLVFSGSAGPVQPARKKRKRETKGSSNASSSSSQLEGEPCTLLALTFTGAAAVETVERFDAWVEDLFQQTSQLQCSHFLPFASLCSPPGRSQFKCFVICYGSQFLKISPIDFAGQVHRALV